MKTLFRIALSVVIVVANLAGMVITQAGASEQGKALVYVAAFAPDEGQAAGELGKAYPAPPGLSHPVVDSAGFMRLPIRTSQNTSLPNCRQPRRIFCQLPKVR
jgi:hypothetical protein